MCKNKILIVPDVHGRKFWIEALNKINMVDKVVFLGDYLDPYPHEGITFDEAIDEFKSILQFKEAFPDKVVLLLGNHDVHYMYEDILGCSRFNGRKAKELYELYQENKNKFKLAYNTDKVLFSHAGVVEKWLEEYCHCGIQEFLSAPLDDIYLTLETVSYLRGGFESYGSCVWSDVREFKNTLPFYQIFGHTQLADEPIIKEDFACLDCRKCFILDTETNKIEVTE